MVFTLKELRQPDAAMSKKFKKRMAHLKELHSKIDEEFLEKRLAPRLVLFMAEDHL